MLFKNGYKYYISNLFLWAIPYRTEGFYRADIDHDPSIYNGKEYFIQDEITYDTIQSSIIRILENRYKLSTVFAMVRQSEECDYIIEAYNKNKIPNPEKLYFKIRNNFENFICDFLDNIQEEILMSNPYHKFINIILNRNLRRLIIKRSLINKNLLSPRELECLKLFSLGLNSKKIANLLFLSPETIQTHAKSIRFKLNCNNITEAAYKAVKWNLI